MLAGYPLLACTAFHHAISRAGTGTSLMHILTLRTARSLCSCSPARCSCVSSACVDRHMMLWTVHGPALVF